jgi:hypothetical protein
VLTFTLTSGQGTGNAAATFSWTNLAGFALYQTDSLNDPVQWVPATTAPILSDGVWRASLVATNGARFYRLTAP